MAKTIPVSYEGKPAYEILIRKDFSDLTDALTAIGCTNGQKLCIVSDSQVAKIYLDQVTDCLKTTFSQVHSFVFEAGEASKNMDTVEALYEHLILKGFDRHDMLIALGGGVVGDLTGFAAATYLRGIRFVQIPTSLLAQVDSSIGGKTGVDFKQYKNMVGAFHQPALVYMNLSVLNTLPKRQLSSGIAEILKHGLIKDAAYFQWMKENYAAIMALDLPVMEEMVYRSCQIKREVVENDPKEKGERALLNFGHTIGHAVEKLSDFQLYHGECVAIGCVAASFLSYQEGNLSKEVCDHIIENFGHFALPVSTTGLDAAQILKTTKSDKKMQAGKINFILLKKIGEAYMTRELTDDQLLEAIHFVLR
ncbi:MAG: 3-dehydroquinate synthase [Lachnospiraceae bacterium]|nr:3-dehydroquinate synthase [Lachnospiraceae bacterium]